MKRSVVAMISLVALAACGARSQQTPEPSDTERVDAVIQQLGTDLTYDSRTLIMNPRPDGLVFRDWIDRRKATLDGTLTLDQLPAKTIPGSVSNTLKWERETQKTEGNANNLHNNYMMDMAMRESNCPQNSAAEKRWLAQQQTEHAKGTRTSLINFEVVTQDMQKKCDAESTHRSAQSRAENQAFAAIREQFLQQREDCKKISEAAEAAYAEALSEETGKAASEASHRRSECELDVHRRWREHDPSGAL